MEITEEYISFLITNMTKYNLLLEDGINMKITASTREHGPLNQTNLNLNLCSASYQLCDLKHIVTSSKVIFKICEVNHAYLTKIQ
jgi:hypothetical protein